MRDAEDVTRPRGRPGRGSWSPPWAHAFSPSGLHKQYQNEISTGDEPTVRQRRSERRCDVTMAAATCSLRRRRRPAAGREGERRVGFGGVTRQGADGEMRVYLYTYIDMEWAFILAGLLQAEWAWLVVGKYEPHSGPTL